MRPSLFAVLVFFSSPASAQLTTMESNNPLPPPPVQGDLDKVTCERVMRTGSRLASDKICMTNLQWKELQQGQRQDFEKVQRIVNMEPADPAGGGSPR